MSVQMSLRHEPDIEQAQHWWSSEHSATFLLRVTQWPAWSSHSPPSHSPYSRADEQPAGASHAFVAVGVVESDPDFAAHGPGPELATASSPGLVGV